MPPGLQDAWDKTTAIVYVTLAQMLCGIAKDLVKLGGKAVTKLVTPNERQGMLFSLVSYVTGFKNSMKGMGYLAGALIVGAFPAGIHILRRALLFLTDSDHSRMPGTAAPVYGWFITHRSARAF